MILLIAFYAAVLFITAWTLSSVLSGSLTAPRLAPPVAAPDRER